MSAISRDASGRHACELGHSRKQAHVAGNVSYSQLYTAGHQTSVDEFFEPTHCALNERATVIAIELLQSALLNLGDGVDHFIASRFFVTRRYRRYCIYGRNHSVASSSVVHVASTDSVDERSSQNLIEQLGRQLAVDNALTRHQCRARLTGARVNCQMWLKPSRALPMVVPANRLPAFVLLLHARAVHHQVRRLRAVDNRQLHLQCLRAVARRHVVQYRQIGEDRAPLALNKILNRLQRRAYQLLARKQCLGVRGYIHMRPTSPSPNLFELSGKFPWLDTSHHVATINHGLTCSKYGRSPWIHASYVWPCTSSRQISRVYAETRMSNGGTVRLLVRNCRFSEYRKSELRNNSQKCHFRS